MPVASFGPLTCGTVGPTSPASDCHPYSTGQLGAVITAATVQFTASSSVGSATWTGYVRFFDVNNVLLATFDTGTHTFASTPTSTLTPTPPAHATAMNVDYGAAMSGSNTSSVTVNGSVNYSYYCEYGTQIATGAPLLVRLSPELVQQAILYRATGPWGFLASLIIGTMLYIPDLCANTRPEPVQWELGDITALNPIMNPGGLGPAWAKLGQWKDWLMWPTFCECTPGATTPYEPPNYIQPAPTGLDPDTDLVLVCDNGDVCSVLEQMRYQMTGIATQLIVMRGELQLVQRQGVPFSYISGPTHGPYSGTGQFTVEDILGLAVSFSAIAPSIGNATATPPNFWRLGELSLGTPDGWLDRQLLHHSQQVVMPISANVTKVGYALEVGCTATFTELVREAAY